MNTDRNELKTKQVGLHIICNHDVNALAVVCADTEGLLKAFYNDICDISGTPKREIN